MKKVMIVSSSTQKMHDLVNVMESYYKVQGILMTNTNLLSDLTIGRPDCIVVYAEAVARTKLFGVIDLRENQDLLSVPMLLIADGNDADTFKMHVKPGPDATIDRDASYSDIKLAIDKLCATSEKSYSILVVDDDPVALKLVRSHLDAAYKVNCVKSGMLALKFLEKQKVDMILLDCFMPEMNGPQTLQLIRNMPGYKRTPVIFLTGNSERNMVMNAINLHPSGFLVKPVRKEELLAKIDEVLET
ncbi:MAG: response regulator [Lachnospiraceae bacterium]|nr:response regulator [Lachnospiraceae bacterium]